MTVTVRTADLRGYAGLLKRNAEHNDQILAYLRQWCGAEMQAVHSEGLLAKALNVHDRLYADAEQTVAHLGRVLRSSAAQLERAAKAYDGADSAAKQRLESQTYAGTVMTREGWETAHSGYADYVHPPSSISGTPHGNEIDDITKILDRVGDATSISGMVLGVIEAATGRRPVEEFVQFFSGDYKAFSRAGVAWRHVGEALEAIGKNVDRGNASMDHGWDGGASEEAYTTFQHIADAFKQMKAVFAKLDEAYQAFSKFAYITASVLADLLKMAIDLAIQIVLKKKGGPFADAFAAFYTIKLVKNIGHFGLTLISARGAVGAIFGGASVVKIADLPISVRSRGYDVPGV